MFSTLQAFMLLSFIWRPTVLHMPPYQVVPEHKVARRAQSVPGVVSWRDNSWRLHLPLSRSITPMLIVNFVLMGLMYSHLMPKNESTYSENGRLGLPLRPAYYVNYLATQLVFFSSVSSLLAPILFSAAIALFSHLTAYFLAVSSDRDQTARLPSPYQLKLLIKTLDAKLMSL